jgi:hypothetical protein
MLLLAIFKDDAGRQKFPSSRREILRLNGRADYYTSKFCKLSESAGSD